MSVLCLELFYLSPEGDECLWLDMCCLSALVVLFIVAASVFFWMRHILICSGGLLWLVCHSGAEVPYQVGEHRNHQGETCKEDEVLVVHQVVLEVVCVFNGVRSGCGS